MKRLPVLSGKHVVKILSKIGFVPKRQKGSHIILIKFVEGKKKGIVVPLHKEIDKGTLLEIIRQAGFKKEEFLNLLKKR